LTCAKLVMGWGLVGFSVAFFEMPRNCEHWVVWFDYCEALLSLFSPCSPGNWPLQFYLYARTYGSLQCLVWGASKIWHIQQSGMFLRRVFFARSSPCAEVLRKLCF
jgi:hypothetical protein